MDGLINSAGLPTRRVVLFLAEVPIFAVLKCLDNSRVAKDKG